MAETDWDKRASTYDQLPWVHNQDLLDWTAGIVLGAVQGAIERTGVDRICEVGCGTGALTERLADHGCVVHALDVSQPMLDRARERVGTRVGSVGYFLVQPEESIPPMWPYAAIVSRMMLHHAAIPPAAETARWVGRVPAGGAIVVAEGPPPSVDDRHDGCHLYRAAMALKEPGRHVFHAHDVAEWLLAAGCAEVRVAERWTTGNSVKRWLSGGGIEPSRAEAILALHREASPSAKALYQIEETADGDITMKWRHCVVSAIVA